PENSAVALLRERLLVQYLGVKPAGRGDPLRLSGESDGHQVGRRGVDQVEDERHRGRQYLRAVSAPGRLRAGANQRERRGAGATAPVTAERVAAEQPAERDRLGLRGVLGGQGQRDAQPRRGRRSVEQRPHRRAGAAAQSFGGGRFLRLPTEADGDDQGGGQPAAGGYLGHLFGLARSAQGGQRRGEAAPQRFVD